MNDVALCNEAKVGDLVKSKKLNCIKLKQLTNKIINKILQTRRRIDEFKGTPEEGKERKGE